MFAFDERFSKIDQTLDKLYGAICTYTSIEVLRIAEDNMVDYHNMIEHFSDLLIEQWTDIRRVALAYNGTLAKKLYFHIKFGGTRKLTATLLSRFEGIRVRLKYNPDEFMRQVLENVVNVLYDTLVGVHKSLTMRF